MENSNNPQIFAQLAAIQREIEAVKKNKTMMGGASYKYRGIDDVMNALHSLFAKHEVVITSKIAECDTALAANQKETHAIAKVEYRFYAKDGSFVENLAIGEGMDNRDKAISKALSQAYKNVLLQVFLIPTEDLKSEVLDAHKHAPEIEQVGGVFPAANIIKKAPHVAYTEIEVCKNKAELAAFWVKSKDYQLDTSFIAAVAKKGNSLQ